ncbi:hypothetical protein MBLNU230_g2795t1 [Neophaeotheca triangularis]
MEPGELDGAYAFAVELGKDAGQMLLRAAEARYGKAEDTAHVEKDSAVDIVTQADHDVEAFVKGRIQAAYPRHKFVGEESYSKGGSKDYIIDDSPTWCVDPLDGTVNYFHLAPFYCVSIALLVGNHPVIGVISAPFLHQLFTACKGKGAWLNETAPLPLARAPLPIQAPKGCVFAFEWGKDRKDNPGGTMQRKVDSFTNMAAEIGGRGGKGGMVHGMRSLGSATLDLAYCAMGAFDIWWEGGCWEWDVAAGICLLEEAGGLVTTANPPDSPETAPIEKVKVGSRLYLAIRGAAGTPEETARQAQERVVREVWKRVQTLEYTRPGV